MVVNGLIVLDSDGSWLHLDGTEDSLVFSTELQ